MKGYKTSKDYKRLKELLDKGYEVVCFTTYDFNKHNPGHKTLMTTDICKGMLLGGWYHFSARGIEYCTYWPEMNRYASFDDMCKNNNIEFIEPTEL